MPSPCGPPNIGLIVGAGAAVVCVEQPGMPPGSALLSPEDLRKLGITAITAAHQAEVEAQRLKDVKAQASAELAEHPSNHEQEPGEPVAAPHTPPISPGPTILLPGAEPR